MWGRVGALGTEFWLSRLSAAELVGRYVTGAAAKPLKTVVHTFNLGINVEQCPT